MEDYTHLCMVCTNQQIARNCYAIVGWQLVNESRGDKSASSHIIFHCTAPHTHFRFMLMLPSYNGKTKLNQFFTFPIRFPFCTQFLKMLEVKIIHQKCPST